MRSRVGLLVAGMSLVVAACSGAAATPAPSLALPTLGQQSAAPPTAAPPTAAPSVAPATAAPTPEPTPVPSEQPSVAASESAFPSLDFSDLTKNLSHLNSYHETFDQTGGAHDLHAKVTIVRSPVLQESAESTGGSDTQRLIIIGTDTYVDTGTGTFVKNMVPVAALQGEFDAFDPGVFLRSFQKAVDFTTIPVVGVETKNGVQAVHFHADSSTNFGPGKPTVPPGAVFDLWVSSDNDYLVALEYSGVQEGGKSVTGSIELTNVNDPSLSVAAPI